VASPAALVNYSTHLLIVSSSFTSGFPGSMSSKQAWNEAQSIRLKSRPFDKF
jgi:hypothetical protein